MVDSGTAIVSVMLAVPDARAAAAWYREALGAEESRSLGSVIGLSIAGAPLFSVSRRTTAGTTRLGSGCRRFVSNCFAMIPTPSLIGRWPQVREAGRIRWRCMTCPGDAIARGPSWTRSDIRGSSATDLRCRSTSRIRAGRRIGAARPW